MITKEDFVHTINNIKSINDRIQKVNELNSDLASAILDYSLQDTLIDVLAKSMNLSKNKYYGNIISWWIYDCDFGKKDPVTGLDGQECLLITAEQLYDLCVKEGQLR